MYRKVGGGRVLINVWLMCDKYCHFRIVVVAVGLLSATTACRIDQLLQLAAPATAMPHISDATCERPPNGCGPAGVFGDIVPECPVQPACFEQACNQHDLCYRRCGIDKSVCDTLFLLEMRQECADRFDDEDPLLLRCESVSYIYAGTVDRLGNEIFQFTQALGCACDARPEPEFAPRLGPVGAWPPDPPFADGDDDLMPDHWELAVGLDPQDADDAMTDPDADGVINLMEFVLGTNPFDPVSYISPNGQALSQSEPRP